MRAPRQIARQTDAEHQLFSIAIDSPHPIYRQLMVQVQRLAATGALAPGDRLPSVREVARTLSVTPMTVSKAYHLLEIEGVLERIRGLGMQVAKRDADGRAKREALLLPSLQQAARDAHQLHLDDHAVLKLFKRVLKSTK